MVLGSTVKAAPLSEMVIVPVGELALDAVGVTVAVIVSDCP